MGAFNGGVQMYYTRPSDQKTYCFKPVPLLGESKEFLKTGAGEELAIIHTLNFDGVLLPSLPALSGVPDESTCISLLDRKSDQMCDALSEDRGTLLVVDASGYPIVSARPIVRSLDFEQGTIVQRRNYSLSFEYETPIVSGYIRDYSNTWEFSQNEDDTIAATHNISAVGIPKSDTGVSAATNAKNFVLARLGINKSQSSIMNTPFVSALIDIDTLSSYNRTLNESIDLTAGSYDVSETFILASGNYKDDRTLEETYNLDELGSLVKTTNINGSIQGYGADTFERLTNAENAFTSVVASQIGWNAISGITSKSKTSNRFAGTVEYDLTLSPSGNNETLIDRQVNRTIERQDDGSVVQSVTTSARTRIESQLGLGPAQSYCYANNYPITFADPIFDASLSGNITNVSVQIDELNNSFQLTRSFVDQTTSLYTEEYAVERTESADTSAVSIVVNGTVRGVGIESSTKSTDRFTSASGAFFGTVEPLIYSRAQEIVPTGSCINEEPVSKTLGYNNLGGTITYSQTFQSRVKTSNPNVQREVVSVSFQNPTDIFSEIPIPGKADGSILQDHETTTRPQKSVSISFTMKRSPGECGTSLVPASTAYSTALTESNVIVSNTSAASSRGEKPISTKVLKSQDTSSFNKETYEFTRNVTWVYI